jgi:hypothetical protein
MIVYANVGFEAAIVLLALDLMDYDARIYSAGLARESARIQTSS